MRNELKKVKVVHFIGIGGIGVSALARKFLLEGAKVSGSDRSESAITNALKIDGAKVFYSHAAKNIPKGTEAVIYTKAAAKDNPELLEAKKRKRGNSSKISKRTVADIYTRTPETQKKIRRWWWGAF